MKNAPHLFENYAHLELTMRALEHADVAKALELLHRIRAQQSAIAALGKFGGDLYLKGYEEAHDLVPKAVNGVFEAADRLERLLLRLELDFTRAAAREHRSTSAKRFDPFWEIFDEIVAARAYRKAAAAYRAAIDAGAPHPYPEPSTARTRFNRLMDEASERLRKVG